jgi:RNA polymerase sigma-32 factor
VWWIRAHIHNHILKSFSLVKLGTTQAQRKLFFSLARTRRELDKMSTEHGLDSDGENVEKIAKKLNVKPAEVEEMSQRMGRRDLSLDAPVGDDGDSTHIDFLAGDGPTQDHEVSSAQERTMLQGGVGAALAQLDARERFIVEQRVMSDQPMSLKEIGEHFGFSRERARQLETRAMEKLEEKLHALAVEVDWPTDGTRLGIEERAVA